MQATLKQPQVTFTCVTFTPDLSVQEIPENAADIAHLAHLHTPGIVSGVDLRYTNSKTWEFIRHDWKVRR